MPFSLQLQCIERPAYSIEMYIPDARQVMDDYYRQKQSLATIPFPYWTKLWASALAMGDWLLLNPEFVQNKNVLELAAGLGFPSFIAARYAESVMCSDYLQEAVEAMNASIRYLQLPNVNASLLDWNNLPADLTADVLLLSDINYDTEQFEQLYLVLQRFLQQGTKILLTTPQRLMAKPFIEKLLPYCRQQTEITVQYLQEDTAITVLLLEV